MRSRWIRPLAAGIVTLIAGLTVIGFYAARRVVDEDQQRILAERGAAVTVLLQSVFEQEIASISTLGRVAATSREDAQRDFSVAAQGLLTGTIASIGVAAPAQHGYVVVGRVGSGPAVGTRITGDLAGVIATANRRFSTGSVKIVHGAASQHPESTSILFAVPVDHVVAYFTSPIHPNNAIPTNIAPFNTLRGAVYASPTPDPKQLVLTNDASVVQLGTAQVNHFFLGGTEWTVKFAANGPLVGGLTASLPWFLLGTGLVIAFVVGLLIRALANRQSYARELVEQRTRSLAAANAELEAAQAVADAANRSKSEFLSRMSHELRTPLNAILGYAQLFELTGVREDQRQPVQQMLASGRHLLGLINEVLDISRIDADKLSLSVEPVGAGEVIHSTVDMLRPAAAGAGVDLIVNADGGDTMVLADRQRLCQILVNLLSNAVKYNHRGGTATVSCCRTEDDTVRISVTDTGRGISPNKYELVFAPFERLDASTSEVEGTGMGLAVSRRLAEAMGSTIGLDSAVGEGSTFWIDLPIAMPAAIPEQAAADRGERTTSETAHSTVLLVEDNPANTKLVERIVELAGEVRLMTTDSGRAAVDIALTVRPDLILLDLHLPDIDGQQVLAALRIDARTADIPIVILSADASPGQVQRLLERGAAAYLTKPIDVRELLNIVTTAGSDR